MSEQDWSEWFAKSFMVFFNGQALRERDAYGHPITDDTFLLLFNAHVDAVTFTVPEERWGRTWQAAIDTAADDPFAPDLEPSAGSVIERPGLSLLVLKRPAV
jgi:glycogen operon protein